VGNPDFSHLALEMSWNLPVNLVNHRRTVFKGQVVLIYYFFSESYSLKQEVYMFSKYVLNEMV